MRVRIVVAVALLLLPSISSAQRIPLPRIGRRGPARRLPLPPQPPPVAQQLAYRRSHLSVESYPMVSYIDSPGLASGTIASWTTFGVGSRADYRFNRFMSATLDLTSSVWGGPARVQTAELGTRFHRERGESRWYPYLDLRVGYISAHPAGLDAADGGFGDPVTPGGYGLQYSQGVGGIAGVGTEYALTRMFSLTTALSVVRGRMWTHDARSAQLTDRAFPMSAVRYTIGLAFNPVRVVRSYRTNTTAGATR